MKTHRRLIARLRATAGFTLAEIILVVAVVSILVSMAAPPVIEFLKRRDIQNEQNDMNEIIKAMRSYLADNNTLPLDTSGTWANEFARYINLSAEEIAIDTWGNPRVYVRYARSDTFLGTPVEIFYATLHSMGPDLDADGSSASAGGAPGGGVGIATSGGGFAAVSDSGWWRNAASDTARINAFVEAQPANDDMMVRFTDYPEKIEKYNASLERLQRIAESLETYARTRYNEMVVFCSTNPCSPTAEQYIYYPRSNDSGNPSSYYPANINNDLTTYNDGDPIYNLDSNHETRRTHMTNLMRILGLPDEYCCNALEVISGTRNEMPFYYFSNPRPRAGVGCGDRPNPQSAVAAEARTLPARLTIRSVAEDPNVCG